MTRVGECPSGEALAASVRPFKLAATTETRNTCTAGYKGIYQDGHYPSEEYLKALNPAFADFAPASNDDIARRCDAFSSEYDPQYSGPRTVLDDNSVAEALSVCAQAADARPARPRYVYLYGTALLAAELGLRLTAKARPAAA